MSDLTAKAEDYYNSIVDGLGFRRFDFWSWDNRAKIYLYRNAEDYHRDPHRVSWSGAEVSVTNKTIASFFGQDGFIDSILPHEMGHIIFREFVSTKINLPLCIDEGVACSQEESQLPSRMQFARELVLRNNYLPFSKLFNINETNKIILPQLFYSQSASIIVFLLQEYGKDNFLEFSRKLRDGEEWQNALLKVYRFSSLDELEESWKNFMLK